METNLSKQMSKLRGILCWISIRMNFLLVFFVGMCSRDHIGIYVDSEWKSVICDLIYFDNITVILYYSNHGEKVLLCWQLFFYLNTPLITVPAALSSPSLNTSKVLSSSLALSTFFSSWIFLPSNRSTQQVILLHRWQSLYICL